MLVERLEQAITAGVILGTVIAAWKVAHVPPVADESLDGATDRGRWCEGAEWSCRERERPSCRVEGADVVAGPKVPGGKPLGEQDEG